MPLSRPPLSHAATSPLNRRSLGSLAAGTAVGVTFGRRVAPAFAQEATTAASPTGGEWTFTDVVGKTVTLPQAPTRIVADLNVAAALADFGITPIAVSGWSVATDAAWGRLDRSTPVINAGPESGAPDLEQLLALKPDLFMTVVWRPDQPETAYAWSFSEPWQLELAEQIMPVIGISATGRADANMETLAEFSASAGVDMDAPTLAAAIADQNAAKAEFARLVAEKADLVSLFGYFGAEGASIAIPGPWADLVMLQGLGLNILVPEVEATEFWADLSAEQANKYPADLMFQSARDGLLSLEELANHPTFGQMPAVRFGQVGVWNQDFIPSYQGLTATLRDVIGPLSTATTVSDLA